MPRADGGDVFLGNETALDVVLEQVAARRVGLDLDDHMGVLTAAAGLLGVLHVALGRLGDGLAVGHAGSAHVGVDVELAQQAVNDDFQVQFAHARV